MVCPAVGVPVGTGVINPGGNYNIWRNNWIYGNAYAGFVTSWVPGFVRERDRAGRAVRHLAPQPVLRQPHGRDARGRAGRPTGWTSGGTARASGSCWQAPSGDGAEPRVLPGCGADGLPAGFGTARYVARAGQDRSSSTSAPTTTSRRSASRPTATGSGPSGLQRIEVKAALAEAVLLGLVLLVLWWRLLSGSKIAFVGLALTFGGLVVGVYGTLRETTMLTALGLGLLGLGWLCCGHRAAAAGPARAGLPDDRAGHLRAARRHRPRRCSCCR